MSKLCFDYGHGGSDNGASYKGRFEKNDILKLGLAVAKEIRRHGVKVDETRTTDKTMSLSERSSFERRKNYDYFISFHRNAYRPKKASGVETFTYTRQSPKAKSLARRIQNNLAALIEPVKVKHKEMAEYMTNKGYEWNSYKSNYIKTVGRVEETIDEKI